MGNGWGRVILICVIFVCSAVVVALPGIQPGALAAYFSMATLAIYSTFHVAAPPMSPPMPGGKP